MSAREKYEVKDREAVGESVRELFQEVFPRGSVELDSDFFALGGDSLTAFRLADALSERLDMTVPPVIIFSLGTPENIAEYCCGA